MPQIIMRFDERSAANTVCGVANQMTNIEMRVDCIPCDGSAGNFCIVADENYMSDSAKRLLYDLVQQAIAVACAAELRKHAPNHPLAQIYHLREDFKPYFMEITA